MGERWTASVGANPQQRARQIDRARTAFLSSGRLPVPEGGVRDVVAASWQRSAQAQVDPDADPPVLLTDDDLIAYRAAHPLYGVIDALRELVGAVADDSEHLMAVSDAAGRLLWVEGHQIARRRAEAMNFVEGALWDEAHAGTNAPGTALALDHEVQIFATEHFRHTVRSWTCAAAPIHDPVTGQILGVIDVTGGDAVSHPHSLALVKAAARAAEGELAYRRAPGSGIWLPAARLPERLAVLGRGEAVLYQDGRQIRLNRRHSEILFLLATHPEGLSGEQLADAMYDDGADPAAIRVELTRLRRVAGDLVQSRPYRLIRPVGLDFDDVAAALRRGDLAAAMSAYAGPLLPNSEAPGVITQRRWLDLRLRSAVLSATNADLLFGWAERFGFDDLDVWERLLGRLAVTSPLRPVAAARVRQLRAEYGLRA